MMEHQIDKVRVANSFSKAAETYDGSALLQQQVGGELLRLFAENYTQPVIDVMVDLGCGTGYFTGRLSELFEPQRMLGFDIAQGMLNHAAQQHNRKEFGWLCADAEAIPLADCSVQALYSSLAIQWCENVPQLFNEIYRTLSLDGVAAISTLGPASLNELRDSWALIDQNKHVNDFIPLESLIEQLPASLEVIHISHEMRVIEYNKLSDLTSDLKNIGAHNMNQGERKGLMNRSVISRLKNNYDQYRQPNNKLPASYEVYYLIVKKVAKH